MRTITVTEKYRAVNEGKLAKQEFVRQMRQLYPMYISQYNGFNDTVQILKNKGMLYEGVYSTELEPLSVDKFPPEAIWRGVDYELQAMGLDPRETVCEEDYNKARDKVLANLSKDLNYYLYKIAGTKNPANDDMVPAQDSKKVDKMNGLTKATLKEGIRDWMTMEVRAGKYKGYIKKGQKGWHLYDKDHTLDESGGPFESLEELMKHYDLEDENLSGRYAEKRKSDKMKALKEAEKTSQAEQAPVMQEDHTANKNDSYVVKKCKDGTWSVWEGEKRVKKFKDKAEAKAYATEQNKKEEKTVKEEIVDETILKEAVKKLIIKALTKTEQVLAEAATVNLADFSKKHAEGKGSLVQAINRLEDLVTEIDSFHAGIKDKIQAEFNKIAEIVDEDNRRVGAYLSPGIRKAFLADLTELADFPGDIKVPTEEDLMAQEQAQMESEKKTVFSPPVQEGVYQGTAIDIRSLKGKGKRGRIPTHVPVSIEDLKTLSPDIKLNVGQDGKAFVLLVSPQAHIAITTAGRGKGGVKNYLNLYNNLRKVLGNAYLVIKHSIEKDAKIQKIGDKEYFVFSKPGSYVNREKGMVYFKI